MAHKAKQDDADQGRGPRRKSRAVHESGTIDNHKILMKLSVMQMRGKYTFDAVKDSKTIDNRKTPVKLSARHKHGE